MPTDAQHLIGNRVASAKITAEKVQEDIELAEAELHLANQVITDKLAETATDADLAKAVIHNEQVEEKLHDAAEDLKLVTDLLNSEERDRKQLEQALAEYRDADTPPLAGARSGQGSASVIKHLRQLTRHNVASDHSDAASPLTPKLPPGSA